MSTSCMQTSPSPVLSPSLSFSAFTYHSQYPNSQCEETPSGDTKKALVTSKLEAPQQRNLSVPQFRELVSKIDPLERVEPGAHLYAAIGEVCGVDIEDVEEDPYFWFIVARGSLLPKQLTGCPECVCFQCIYF